MAWDAGSDPGAERRGLEVRLLRELAGPTIVSQMGVSSSDTATVTRERPASSSSAYVVVLEGARSRALVLPGEGTVDIGREDQCFVRLDDESVSRRHATLTLPELVLEDLGSKNGTRVGGSTLAPGERVVLRPGSLVQIGDATLLFQRGALPEQRVADHPETDRGGEAMQRVLRAVRCVAADDITVLLLGETGVGKEVMAERIHRRSRRRDAPFVRVHCAAISDTLFEAELFGHEKGAFTGATTSKPGLLESAEGGTVFIDEVGELPPHVQVKLLRVLEDRRVRRIGSRDESHVDVRYVAATNRDLERDVATGDFRQDLYFRLGGFTIRIPPLRERVEEIVPLAREFLTAMCVDKGMPDPGMTSSLVEALEAYPWPGNVRELKNLMRRLLVMSEGSPLSAADLPQEEMERRASLMLGRASSGPTLDSPDEDQRIRAALELSGGNQTEAARLLGMARRTLIKRLDQYEIPRPRKK